MNTHQEKNIQAEIEYLAAMRKKYPYFSTLKECGEHEVSSLYGWFTCTRCGKYPLNSMAVRESQYQVRDMLCFPCKNN